MNPITSAVKHSLLRTVSVICVLAVIALLGLGIKRLLYPRATESYAQKADQITNIEHNYYPNKKVFGLGLTLWGLDIGIMKYDYSKEVKK